MSITCGQQGKLLFLDFDPLEKESHLVEADLHNHVRLKSRIPEACSLFYLPKLGAVVLCCQNFGVAHQDDNEASENNFQGKGDLFSFFLVSKETGNFVATKNKFCAARKQVFCKHIKALTYKIMEAKMA